jgi:hypothetical protein
MKTRGNAWKQPPQRGKGGNVTPEFQKEAHPGPTARMQSCLSLASARTFERTIMPFAQLKYSQWEARRGWWCVNGMTHDLSIVAAALLVGVEVTPVIFAQFVCGV